MASRGGNAAERARAARRRRARQQGRARLLLVVAVLVALVVALVLALPRGGRAHHPSVVASPAPAYRGSPVASPPPSAAVGTRISPARPAPAHAVVSGTPASDQVALTFDDGFCASCVRRIVDVLWRTDTHATLFPNGMYARAWAPQAARIRAMIARGQIVVGNHTYLHHDALTESPVEFARDLDRNEEWIERTFGISGRPWFRPPYGAYDSQTLAVAGSRGYTRVILWSGTLADSTPQTVPYLRKAVRDWGHPGTIILAHANYLNTARDLPELIRLLQQQGLRLVTIAELNGAAQGRKGTPTSASPAIPAH